jgi:putative flippase GtrA
MTQSLSTSAEPAVAGTSASLTRQGSRFTVIGSAGTGLQLGLYAVLAAFIGAQIASAVSWLLSTLVTNRVHRALTFEVHEHAHSGSDQTVAFVTSLAGLGITSIVLAELADASGLAGLIAILAVNTAVGAGRFFGLRWWMGESGRQLASAVALSLSNIRGHISARHISLHH